MWSIQGSDAVLKENGLNFVNFPKSLITLFFGLIVTLPAMGGSHDQPVGQAASLSIPGTTETSINGISFISPVTQSNFDTVLTKLRQRGTLRNLTASEANTLMTATPPGTYYFAYGFQLVKDRQPADFIVNDTRGANWHQFELHKLPDGEAMLLGFTTSIDADKFEYYSKTYGPTPKMVPQPVENYNILVILPFRLISKVINQELQFSVGRVSVIDAAVFPIKE